MSEALKVLNEYFKDGDHRGFMKLKFAKNILESRIRFKSASAKLLIPSGTLFICKELMEILHKFHPELDALSIKQEPRGALRHKHDKLMGIINNAYSKMINNNDISDDDVLNHRSDPIIINSSVPALNAFSKQPQINNTEMEPRKSIQNNDYKNNEDDDNDIAV